MASSDPKTPESPSTNTTPDDQNSKEPAIDTPIAQESTQENETPKNPGEEGGDEGDGEEEGECGFCLYMKGGGCRDVFTKWEDCIKAAEDNQDNIVNKCYDVTSSLRVCMQANADYYEPILRAEKAAEEEALKELDKEKEKEKASQESGGNTVDNQEKAVDSEHSKSDRQSDVATMASSDPKTPESPSTNPTPDDQNSKEPASSSIDTQIAQESTQEDETPKNPGEEGGKEDDGEEEGECGFCLYMKEGGCRDVFTKWEDCIKAAEDNQENIVNKCYDVTSSLRVCMQANAEYYEPILRAEKAAEEEALKELEKEKEKEKASEESEGNTVENQEKAVDSEHSKSGTVENQEKAVESELSKCYRLSDGLDDN